ncbi:MAG TPA: Fic family protein [Caulobacteraceae bacterium]|jgi:Fic family protein|nr:Fic family protein [Caulobacteraceae bacterium]
MPEYIHERDDWPKFRWSQEKLAAQLAAARNHQGRIIGRMETLGFQLRAEAVLQTLTEEVTKSSEIEGENLDRDQVWSSLARRLGMDIAGLKPAERNVEGIVEMMLDATQKYAEPLTEERLFAWHAALFPTGRRGMKKIITGAWRDEDAGPMQVVSGPIGRERVHFEAPTAKRLTREMRAFLKWFNSPPATDPVLKAATAHLWFVTIHPFEDGNGRIARAIADMALARSDGSPQRFYSMSAQIHIEKKTYYEILERTQKGDVDITRWFEWFLGCLDRAFDGADAILAVVLRKARFWQGYAGEAFNDRQRLMLSKLLDGFEGKLTSSKWALITKTSQDTASRDIDDLMRRHILFKEPGGGRSTSYMLVVTTADPLHAAAAYARQNAGSTVWNGAKLPTNEERAKRRENIHALAAKLDDLAEASLREAITYLQFEALRDALREQGFFIDDQLVLAAAFAFHRDETTPPLLAGRS